jgi:archaellum component FlaG (FlaF/FlaG flagellin family)
MLFFWILLFIAVFLVTVILIVYLTNKLNEIEKDVNNMYESVKNDYALPPDPEKKKKKKK